MKKNFLPTDRHRKILAKLKQNTILKVDDLALYFSVTPMTIRRDLNILEKEGHLEKIHGGAILSELKTKEALYSEKDSFHQENKVKMAAWLSQHITSGDTLFINSGSTMFYVIQELAYREDIQIVTNNYNAISALPENATVKLLLLGGEYRKKTGCSVGEIALSQIHSIFSNKTILGVDGISLKEGLTSSNKQEASITNAMIKQSRGSIFVVTTHDKIGRITPYVSSPLNHITSLITDDFLGLELTQEIENYNIKIISIANEKSDKK